MIAGATDKGICFLEWYDRGGVERILSRVEKRYKRPLEQGSSELLRKLQNELSNFFDRTINKFLVPLDVNGTIFEKRVWDKLLKIPYGETRSYGEIASEIGKPGASRAVGRANGSNYLAIVIPCHRVIESNGKLRGYGSGLWRKKYLLDLESTKIASAA
ncbi:MAG: methylated-DNA--[protein]-cysteine S-methyltransferase [Candidatus Marinimicrobia bacterium]|nr:methylated-DNA--[protein]-cysteine S-methyltransferase [Candidatus Neomarinimicrobiota bacterium]